MKGTAQTIKEKLSVVDVISTYVKLDPAGGNFKSRCPFHQEKTPSFFVSPTRGSFYCFGCGEKGDIFSFVEKIEGVDFKGALKILADRAGVELVREDPQARNERERLYDVLLAATKYFEETLARDERAKHYLRDRGVSEKTAKEFQIGFAEDKWRGLHGALLAQGFREGELEKAGLIKYPEKEDGAPATVGRRPYDRFRSRIIFPIADSVGRTVAFSGRLFEKEEGAKYINSPETDLFSKSKILYGFDRAKNAIRSKNYAILVEGQMDLVMSHQAGFENTVALSGTALTIQHIESLKRLSGNLLIVLDADSAGVRASLKAGSLALSQGLTVKLATISGGKDPADMLKEGDSLYREVLKKGEHIIDFYLGKILLRKLDQRKTGQAIEKELLPFVRALPSHIEQAHFVSVIARKTGIREEALFLELKKIKAQALVGETAAESFKNEKAPKESRKEMLVNRLFAILYIFEEKGDSEKDVLREKIVSLLPPDRFEAEQARFLSHKEELLFEMERKNGEEGDLHHELRELVNTMQAETLKEELSHANRELRKAEEAGDKDAIEKYSSLCQNISLRLSLLTKSKV